MHLSQRLISSGVGVGVLLLIVAGAASWEPDPGHAGDATPFGLAKAACTTLPSGPPVLSEEDRDSMPVYLYFLVASEGMARAASVEPFLEPGSSGALVKIGTISSEEEEAEHLAAIRNADAFRLSKGLSPVIVIDLR